MKFETHGIVALDHPSLAGHFPGNPVVPGVVLLDEVATALMLHGEYRGLEGFSSVKFLASLPPGERFGIEFEGHEQRVKFRCTVMGRLIAQGELLLTRS